MDDQTKAIAAGIVRHLIGIAGTYLAAHGVMVSGSDMDMLSGAVMVLGTIAWSIWHKTTVQPK